MNFYQHLKDLVQMEKVENNFGHILAINGLSKAKHLGLAPVFGIVKRSCGYNRINSKLGQGLILSFISRIIRKQPKKSVQKQDKSKLYQLFLFNLRRIPGEFWCAFPDISCKTPHWFLPGYSFLKCYKTLVYVKFWLPAPDLLINVDRWMFSRWSVPGSLFL